MFSKNGSWQDRYFLKEAACIEGGQYVLLMVSVLQNKSLHTRNKSFSEVRVNENSIQQESEPTCSLVYFSWKKCRDLVGISTAFQLLLSFKTSYPDCLKAMNPPPQTTQTCCHFTSHCTINTHAHTITSILALLRD